MCCRFWRVLHPLLTLAAVACSAWLVWKDQRRPDPERLSTNADTAVRNFLDLRWLGGDYELPAGEHHCAVGVLEFEDGKFRRRRSGTVFSPKPGESRVVPYYVMWGRGHEGTRVVSGWPGSWMAIPKDTFFANIDSAVSRAHGPVSLSDIRGYRVIGFAVSQQPRAGHESFATTFADLERALEKRQFVAVLGLKVVPTREEAEQWLYGTDERGSP
jgi:hypothetical protein